jgi:hypothetical protein
LERETTMATKDTGINWVRVIVALVLAELLPILLLLAVVVAYTAPRQQGGVSPGMRESPRWGEFVLPIGAFVATWLLSLWAARGARARHFAHGAVVGVGTAVVDIVVTLAAGYAISPAFLLLVSGRIVGGVLGGWLGSSEKG